ncbi:MAG: RagB/SusD family nutrient uptake outer membrane protein [Ferruginibacter sp.]
MKLFKKIIWAFVFMATLNSCEKNLTDLQPLDQIPAERAISTMNDLTAAVNGVYGTWAARRSVYISALISDEVRLGTGTEYRNVGNALFNWQFVSDSQDWRDGETGGVWTNLYAVIDRANRTLELGAKVPTPSAADVALKNQFFGEMLALRAMAHLELLRCFSKTNEYNATAPGVVLQTTYVKNVATYQPARNAQKQVVDQINADLISARALIPATFGDIGRVTRNAVIGAQVRVAMHTKDWQGVIDRANEIISLQPLTNIASYPAIWTTRNLIGQGTEVIWKLTVTASNTGSAIGSLFQDANAAQQAAPAAKLLNTYNTATDVRFSAFFRTTPRPLIAKYGFLPQTGETFIYDIKMMRTSEMVLARAEAYAELATPNITASNADLSLLRSNRITGYVHVPLATKTELIDAIILERYRELCYEGQRYFDLKRRSLPIVRDVSDIGGIASSQTLPVSDFHYILPIPFQEVQANPNIGQNVGY